MHDVDVTLIFNNTMGTLIYLAAAYAIDKVAEPAPALAFTTSVPAS
jgi:hypothetical protein